MALWYFNPAVKKIPGSPPNVRQQKYFALNKSLKLTNFGAYECKIYIILQSGLHITLVKSLTAINVRWTSSKTTVRSTEAPVRLSDSN